MSDLEVSIGQKAEASATNILNATSEHTPLFLLSWGEGGKFPPSQITNKRMSLLLSSFQFQILL